MALLNTEIARRELGRVQLRAEPMRLRWTFEDLVSSDGHALKLTFSCSAKALSDPTEQRLLEEAFLATSDSMTVDDVREHFRPAFRAAAASVCQSKSAEEWANGSNGAGAALTEAIRSAGKRLAFSSGLELLPPFQADVESPSLERQRVESMQRSLAEQRAAGQVQHFQRATELLKQFESIRQSMPSLSPGEVLKQINPADQGVVLQTLLLAAGKQQATEQVWAVAGPNLVKIDPRSSPAKATVTPLPTTLGPLRSVQPTLDKALLVGARSGVMRVDPDQPSAVEMYSDTGVTSALGFSRAVTWQDEIWACHGEAGIVAWKRRQFDRPFFVARPAEMGGAAAKNIQVLDGARLIFSTQNRLMVVQRTRTDGNVSIAPVAGEMRAEIIAVLPDGERVVIVAKNGGVQVRDAKTLAVIDEHNRGGETCAAVLMPWLGSTRLLLATDDGPIQCVGLDDDLTTQYLNPFGGLRGIASAADLIVGISGDRQRVVLWQPWNARQPAGDVFVTAVARHRVADVDI